MIISENVQSFGKQANKKIIKLFFFSPQVAAFTGIFPNYYLPLILFKTLVVLRDDGLLFSASPSAV